MTRLDKYLCDSGILTRSETSLHPTTSTTWRTERFVNAVLTRA